VAIKVTLTGDTADLKSKLQSLGVEFEELDDSTIALGKSAQGAGDKMAGAFDKDMESRIAGIEDATRRAAEATETLAQHAGGMNEMAEALGNTERVLLGVNDVLGVAAEQFGVNIGPAQEYAQAAADVAGGLEGIIGGGMALMEQAGPLVAKITPVIASTWAQTTALYAQAAAWVAANAPILIIIGSLALLAAGVLLVIKYWDPLVEKFPVLGQIAAEVEAALTGFKDFLTGPFVEGLQALWDKFDVVFKAVEILISAYLKAWAIYFETGFGVIKGIIDIFAGIFTGDMDRVKEGVLAIFRALWDGAKALFELGIQTISNLVPLALEAAKGLGGAIKDGIVTLATEAITFLTEMPGKIVTAFGNAGEILLEVGKDIVRGLIKGIQDMAGEALDTVGNLAGDLKDKAKDKLKIWSPSKVFEEIGVNVVKGLENGIFEEGPKALSAVDTLAIGLRRSMEKLWEQGGGPDAAMERMIVALKAFGYTAEEIEPHAKKLLDSLIEKTNEAGDGAITFADAIGGLVDQIEELLGGDAAEVVKDLVATPKKAPAEISSANASGSSLFGIGGEGQGGILNKTPAAKSASKVEEKLDYLKLLYEFVTGRGQTREENNEDALARTAKAVEEAVRRLSAIEDYLSRAGVQFGTGRV